MKVAVEDPFLELLAQRGRKVEVFLDGIRQDSVVSADEEAGVVVRYARKDNGDFFVDGGSLRVETKRGRVLIEIERL